MDDQILSNEPEAPAPAAPPPPAPQQDAGRMDRLEQAMAQLTDTVRDAANRLTQAPLPAPPQRPDEFLNDLAADPQGVIQRVANAEFQRAAAQSLNPAVLQVLDTANAQLLAGHKAKIDADMGEGTFDQLFKPQLDKDVSQLRQVNPRAVADPATLDALVSRLYGGDNFPLLMEKRRNLEKNYAQRGVSHLLPTGGVPRLRVGNPNDDIPPDAEQFLREVERSTGESVDRKTYTIQVAAARLDLPAAVKHFESAARVQPTNVRFLTGLGTTLSALKRYDEAEFALRQAFELAPGDEAVRNSLQEMLRASGRGEKIPAIFSSGRAPVAVRVDQTSFTGAVP